MVRQKTKSAPATIPTQLPFASVNAHTDDHAALKSSREIDDVHLHRNIDGLPTLAATSHLVKAEHANSRAARRGPMDEMRQLIRILAKLMPQSEKFLRLGGEDSGGNRVSEEQIRAYLATSLEGAPQPKWGLPDGWGQYLADLFNWALKADVVTAEQARRCAKRGTGRPWEAVWSQVYSLGVYPDKWPVPLQREGVDDAQMLAMQNPAGCQPPPGLPVASTSGKRSGSDDGPTACKRQKVTAQSTMRPAGLPTALSNIGNSTHSSVVPPISALCNWQSDALLKNILNSITELQGRSEAERGSVAQQAEVFAALLHLMPQVGRQVSGGQITAPINSQTHHSLIAQHAKLVKRQEQLLQFQHRLLLSQGNAAGRIPIPSGGVEAGLQGGARPGGGSQRLDGGKGMAGDAGKVLGVHGTQEATQDEPFSASQMAFVHSLQEGQSQDPLLLFSQGNLDPLSQSLPMLQNELSGPDILSQDFKAGPFSQELRHQLQLSQSLFPSQPDFTFSQPVGSQAGVVVPTSTEQQGIDKGAEDVA